MFSNDLVSHFSEQQLALASAFFRYSMLKLSEAHENKTRFVHYTSAENALRIIRSNEVTLRNARLMNDFSEGHHGLSLVQQLFATENEHSRRFRNLLDSIHIGLPDVINRYFELYGKTRFTETFMLSLSEHGNEEINEDIYGRLSIWRAYGGDTNVAFVVNSAPFVRASNALNAYTSPVLYADAQSFPVHFSSFLDNIEERKAELSQIPIDEVAKGAAYAMHVATLSTKHPAFAEEREWRIIYSPGIERSNHVAPEIISIGGIPQRVHKIRLEDIPSEGLHGMSIENLLDRLLIGPTAYSWPIADAFVEELFRAGVRNPSEKIWDTRIPLRK